MTTRNDMSICTAPDQYVTEWFMAPFTRFQLDVSVGTQAAYKGGAPR